MAGVAVAVEREVEAVVEVVPLPLQSAAFFESEAGGDEQNLLSDDRSSCLCCSLITVRSCARSL